MRRIIAASLCLQVALFSCALLLHAKDPKAAADGELMQTFRTIEQSWLDAEKSSDPTAFEKLAADDWIGISPAGKYQTRAELAAEIKNGHVEKNSLGEIKVRVFGTTAVVTGSDDSVEMQNGKPVAGHYVFTDVFVKRNGKWLAVASQTALAPAS